MARRRAARPRVHPRRPGDDRAAARAAPGDRAGTARQAERDANEREEAILERLHAALVEGRPIRDTELDPDEEKAIRGFRFLTQKPVLVLLNVGEADIRREAELVAGIAGRYAAPARPRRRPVGQDRDGARRARPRRGGGVHGRAGPGRLEPRPGDRAVVPAARADQLPDRRPRRGPRLADPRRARRRSTRPRPSTPTWPTASSGPRRWPYEDLVELGSIAEARKHGRLRSEGKTYHVRDGDVVEILFSR